LSVTSPSFRLIGHLLPLVFMRRAGNRGARNKRFKHPLWSCVTAAFLMMCLSTAAGFCQKQTELSDDSAPEVFPGPLFSNGVTLYSYFVTSVRCENSAEADVENTLFLVRQFVPSSDLDPFSLCVAVPLDPATRDTHEPAADAPVSVSSSSKTSSMNISPVEEEGQSEKVQWKSLMKASSRYLGVMHG